MSGMTFALRLSPTIGYPHSEDPTESIPLRMLALARVFRGPAGTMIKAEMPTKAIAFDPSLALLNRMWRERKMNRSPSSRDNRKD
jgi:hypothetical protein